MSHSRAGRRVAHAFLFASSLPWVPRLLARRPLRDKGRATMLPQPAIRRNSIFQVFSFTGPVSPNA